MKLRIAIVVMFYLFINQVLVCQTQVGIVDLDSITDYWMEELGLVEIKKNYQEKLRELGRKELKFLQEKYLQINTCPEQRLTKDEIRKEQEQLENDQKRIKALELYPEVLNQDFEEIQEHLKYVLMNELNSVGNLENRIFLDKEAIIYAENPKNMFDQKKG